jgi:hypothetical protein
MEQKNLQLVYTLLCDDERLEVGNKISLMEFIYQPELR